MADPIGPGSPFQLFFDDATPSDNPSASLPESFQKIYGSDWVVPVVAGRPYIYSNFAQSRDGRISFADAGIATGGDVTGFNAHDRWLMGLLRTRADAILMGDVTVTMEAEAVYCAESVSPKDAASFTALRKAEARSALPTLVILSLSGKIDWRLPCFQDARLNVLLATTASGAASVSDCGCAASVEVLALGEDSVDLHRLVTLLYETYDVHNLLCEGGSRVFANLLDAHLIDEEFVTLCPTFIGRTPTRHRPSYTEGVAWTPATAPYSKPLSLRRAGDMLYMRTQVQYKS
ncbi:MAG: dihydrofolate reductase family protein [Caldilineaceae bacterium]|nr:dihydrofolate reductase family protein [Caldilineaceae bacterium]